MPNISKWNVNNVKSINNLFSKCSSLIELPNLGDWEINKITDLSYVFDGCSSLKKIPDISRWNFVNEIKNISYLFQDCSSITEIPDISTWDISKTKKIHIATFVKTSITSLTIKITSDCIISYVFLIR